jgi:glycosyltransferase involved in cell wall biosynthesis
MPEVSVVIPTYNRAAWLPETIASARRAGGDCEIIVVDDASTDETPEICRAMDGIRYIRFEDNSGSSHARNVAIRESSGDLIAFLDDDDLRLPGSLDSQVALLKASPDIGLVYGRAFLGEPRFSLPVGMVVPEDCPAGDLFWPLLEANFIVTSTVVARKRCLLDVGMFDPSLHMIEDYDLWVRLAERYPLASVPEPVAIYRMRDAASGQKTSDRAAHDRLHKQLHARMLRSPRAAAAPARRRRHVHRRHMNLIYGSLIHDAALALLSGDSGATRNYLLAAVRLRPFHIKAHISLLWLFARNLLRSFGR